MTVTNQQPTQNHGGSWLPFAVVGILSVSPTLRKRWGTACGYLIPLGLLIWLLAWAAGPGAQSVVGIGAVVAGLGVLGGGTWLLATGAAAIGRVVAKDWQDEDSEEVS
jgi:hypothetical protein